MNRNIKLLIAGLLICSTFDSNGQLLGEIQDFEYDSSLEEEKADWQVGLDLTSVAAGLLGGYSGSNFRLGAQIKRIKNDNAFRGKVEYYPQSGYTEPFNHSDRQVGTQGPNLIYLAQDYHSELLRLGFGFEKGRARKWGRTYYGIDISANYENTSLATWNYVEDPTDDIPNRLDNFPAQNRTTVRSFGPGLSPLMGIELPFWRGFGVNVEAKFDIALMSGEGVSVDDAANITKSGAINTFRTFPLLDFKMYYRF